MTDPLFSAQPGARERQLMRRRDNPLFPPASRRVTEADVMAARKADQAELAAFMEGFHQVVQRAVDLEANVQSDQVLDLKEELDRCYEECAGLAGDQGQIREAIARLVASIMVAVRKGAGNDATALQKLAEEDTARELHYRLLETPLVADLLRPDQLIGEQELLPTLLSATPEELNSAIGLFTPEQLGVLVRDARELASIPDLTADAAARVKVNLALMEAEMTRTAPGDTIN